MMQKPKREELRMGKHRSTFWRYVVASATITIGEETHEGTKGRDEELTKNI